MNAKSARTSCGGSLPPSSAWSTYRALPGRRLPGHVPGGWRAGQTFGGRVCLRSAGRTTSCLARAGSGALPDSDHLHPTPSWHLGRPLGSRSDEVHARHIIERRQQRRTQHQDGWTLVRAYGPEHGTPLAGICDFVSLQRAKVAVVERIRLEAGVLR